jgi:hypothetical protein
MKTLGKTLVLTAFVFVSACSPSAATPTPPRGLPGGGGQPAIGPVFIDSAELLIAESHPVQPSLNITGNLPNPCASFHYAYTIGSETDRHRIDVNAWSESNPDLICAQVLEPLDESLPIDMNGAADGAYSVWLNGDFVGVFSYPA